MRFMRERPMLAAAVAFMHFPILMGLWVMAAETFADLRERLSVGDSPSAAMTAGHRSAAT